MSSTGSRSHDRACTVLSATFGEEARMSGGTLSTTIQAPIERVWAVVGDLNTHPSWSPKHYEMVWTSCEPNEVGSRLRSVGSIPGSTRNENDVETTERVVPTKLAFSANDPQGVFLNEWNLRSTGPRVTEVSYTITFPKMRGIAALLAPFLFPLWGKPDVRERFELLKQTVEAGG
jgi:uncharacterized protein YndB with AHSA1/START domain